MTKFAAIGDDGTRPVVWGVGSTEDEALEDAGHWLAETTGSEVRIQVVKIDDSIFARIKAGDISWP